MVRFVIDIYLFSCICLVMLMNFFKFFNIWIFYFFFKGNFLVIIFVSYFGVKFYRLKIIGVGCLIMGVGTLFIVMF